MCECYSSSSPEKKKKRFLLFLSQLAEEAIYTRFCDPSHLYNSLYKHFDGIFMLFDAWNWYQNRFFNLLLKELGLDILSLVIESAFVPS